MTAKRSDSTAKQSRDRQKRREARRIVEKKIGRKLKPGEQVDHIKSKKKNGGNYSNASGNLRAVSTSAHKKKTKKETGGGRPVGSRDSMSRRKRTKK